MIPTPTDLEKMTNNQKSVPYELLTKLIDNILLPLRYFVLGVIHTDWKVKIIGEIHVTIRNTSNTDDCDVIAPVSIVPV